MSPRVFVSYRKADGGFAAVLLDETLRGRFGDDVVFRDSRSIPLAMDFRSELWRALRDTGVLLAVIGPGWLTVQKNGARRLDDPDDYVRQEIEHAIRFGLHVIPVLIGDTALPSANDLPKDMRELVYRQYHRISVRTASIDLSVLVDQVARLLGHSAGGPTPPAPPTPAPVEGEGHYTVVAVRIGGFADRPDKEQGALRATMYEQLHLAAGYAGLPWTDFSVQDYIDGVHLLVPGSTPPAAVLVEFLGALEKRLADLPAMGRHEVRLRVAIHLGLASRDSRGWAGAALALADRLVAAPALTRLLEDPYTRLALIVSESVYTTVVKPGHRRIDQRVYRAVEIRSAGVPTIGAWVRDQNGISAPRMPRWAVVVIVVLVGIGVFGGVSAYAIANWSNSGASGLDSPGTTLPGLQSRGSAASGSTSSGPDVSGSTTIQLTDNGLGTPLYVDTAGTPSAHARIPVGTEVRISCKVRNTVAGMSSVMYWYRIESEEWRGQYAPSDTFANGDTPRTGGTTRVAENVPDC
ncbi:toll/interleukin-1 receptor domain-containing protein [Micromonospora sp. NPDC005413]|uniref:toll/interleukin-1 receptor domain-containing protein n=1 Tax=Micromonospora sp. NPDC005413 TaxID=3154563 RepID=UPI0033ABF553